ncbi:protein FAR1-related sequence 5-like [Rhizophagus clarus]|uniref:Protein FAR1-related sequence 5-like n=1 Tax=Rhizophagus clarus TaxID=94130 RepID=A0A8H3LRN3_9GLOM|nr:protein FAR1-related sequence 5-like [Rhizophagus clarus]
MDDPTWFTQHENINVLQLEYYLDDDEQDSLSVFDEPNVDKNILFSETSFYADQDTPFDSQLETMQHTINTTDGSSILEDSIPDLALNVEYSSWDDVGKALLKYGYNNGFVWVKKRIWPINGRMAGISFYCDKSGINIPKKTDDPTKKRNKKSKKCGCEVHVNISWPKCRTGPYVSLFKDIHNHVLHQDTARFASAYCKLSSEIFSEIEFYTNSANLDASLQRQLLEARYPDREFHSKDISNAIQKAKHHVRMIPGNEPSNDASNLLKQINTIRSDDLLWFVEYFTENNFLSRIFWMNPKQINLWMKFSDVVICDTTFGTNRYNISLMLFIRVDRRNHSQLLGQALTCDEREESFNWIIFCLKKATSNISSRIIFTDADAALPQVEINSQLASCIFHIKQNLKKHIRPKIQSEYSNFIIEFDNVQNALNKQEFYTRWEALLHKYPSSQPYLHNNLYSLHYSWAKCFVNCIFNAGMQSTQRVEGMNSVLKRLINRHSTLCELFHDIEKRIKTENFKDEYQQIKDSFMYDVQLFEDYTAILDDFEETSINAKECNLESLLKDVGESSISELWEVKYAFSGSKSCNYIAVLKDRSHLCTCLYIISRGLVCRHFFRILRASNNAKFNMALIASRWYKDDISNNIEISNNSSTCNFSYIQQIQNTIRPQPNSKEHLSKRKRYGKIYGLARHVIQLAVDNDDTEPT